MQQHRKLSLSTLAGLALVFVAIGDAPRPALAQATPAQSGPQILITPYLWLAGINSAIKTPRPEVPTVDSSVGAFQLLGHLNGVPFMGSAEVRDGPFSLLGDVLHVPVGTNITTRNIFFQGGNAALTANTGTALFLYHALDQPFQELDIGGGFRAWGFSTRLTLNGGLLPTVNLSRRGLGRSFIRRAVSPRLQRRFRADRLWRFWRLRCRRGACRLAADRHPRLCPEAVGYASSRLSQPQLQLSGWRQCRLQCAHERADPRCHLPVLSERGRPFVGTARRRIGARRRSSSAREREMFRHDRCAFCRNCIARQHTSPALSLPASSPSYPTTGGIG